MNKSFSILINSLLLSLFLLPWSLILGQSSTCQLPEWFFDKAKYNSTSFSIGISDVRLEKEEALKQAKLKALLNLSILNNAKYSVLTTSGLGNLNENNNIESTEFVVQTSIITGEILFPDFIEVIDSAFTRNKEAIVLIKSPTENTSKRIYKYAITRRAGFQKEGFNNQLYLDELETKIYNNDSTIYSSKIVKENNKIFNQKVNQGIGVFSFLNNIKIFNVYNNCSQKDTRALPSPLNFGLWNAYLFNLVDQICIYSSFKTDFHYKLSSSNIGTLDEEQVQKTIQEYVHSLKNVQSRDIRTKLKNIAIEKNQLYCFFKIVGENYDFGHNTISVLSKQDRKELNELKEKNWQYLGNQQVKNAWFEAKHRISSSPDYLVTGIDISANNLSSGILEAINLAKLELSSLLNAKISALTMQNQTDNKASSVHSAKLLNITKTKEIKPFYIFYRKINQNSYKVKVILFYKFTNA